MQATELVDVARTLKSHGDLDETVLISTCNRVEIYGTTRRAIDSIKSLFRLLCSETADLTSHIYLYEDVAAARHLLGVTVGLGSVGPKSPAKLRTPTRLREQLDLPVGY